MMFTSDMIQMALEEDVGHGDITTEAVVPASLRGTGRLVAKEDGVIAGLGIFGGVFSYLDSGFQIRQIAEDGRRAARGDVLAEIHGPFAMLLRGERVALNFIQRLSGIATHTRRFADLVEGTKTRILDTRKTLPLYRHLEKYAVRMGGGTNHRWGLYDEILIKDNHIFAAGSSLAAVRACRARFPDKKITVEVSNLEDLETLLGEPVSRFLLDNMRPATILRAIEKIGGRSLTEISGGVTLENLAEYAPLGADYISVGSLTHSARALDMNFKISPA